jgi:1,4-alpha-glucan branching enzyme
MLLTADYPEASWSGIGAAVEVQAEALAACGADVDVVAASPHNASPLRRRTNRVRVHELSGARFPISARGFDWVHLHSLALAELALELRKRFPVRLAYTAHSLIARELQESPAREFWSRVQLAVMRASDGVVFLSESERAAALEIAPELRARAHVVGNAVWPGPAPYLRSAPDGPVVFAGRFARSKGISLLAAFVSRLARVSRVKFVLAGGHGDRESEGIVTSLAARLGGACHLAGWLPPARLRLLFQRSALVVMPSEYEPFGMAALEAMSAGAPVLAARTGGLAEMMRPESGGCLAASRDPDDWCDHARAILSNRDEWCGLHERGPHYAAARFHPKSMALRLMQEAYAC